MAYIKPLGNNPASKYFYSLRYPPIKFPNNFSPINLSLIISLANANPLLAIFQEFRVDIDLDRDRVEEGMDPFVGAGAAGKVDPFQLGHVLCSEEAQLQHAVQDVVLDGFYALLPLELKAVEASAVVAEEKNDLYFEKVTGSH
jgi:hypothetical protein